MLLWMGALVPDNRNTRFLKIGPFHRLLVLYNRFFSQSFPQAVPHIGVKLQVAFSYLAS